ncbi:hypothetical protein E2C01_080590 [Portunus trituberculatus]|uniref:Uncharacterized protein n=1 Tax=Portunus trituberculatus TaxID=210409 RepID=A0A5B7ITN2_PORTR|nr:hypothetical protein [Portunus trituberculatus]
MVSSENNPKAEQTGTSVTTNTPTHMQAPTAPTLSNTTTTTTTTTTTHIARDTHKELPGLAWHKRQRC